MTTKKKRKEPKNKATGCFYPFVEPVVTGHIIKRYKRFLADVRLANGEIVTAHVANSGSMATCWEEGAAVHLSQLPEDGKRKLLYSLQAVEMPDGRVLVNTMLPNKAVELALLNGVLPSFKGYELLQREVKFDIGSRLDLCLYNKDISQDFTQGTSINLKKSFEIAPKPKPKQKDLANRPCVIEIKNATMRDQGNGVIFPDAVTTRGQKHLQHLAELSRAGWRCIILFFASRENTDWVGIAKQIDPTYFNELKLAMADGVEAIGVSVGVGTQGIEVLGELPVRLD